MKPILAALVLSCAGAGGASAQTADFKCPAIGTQFSFQGGPLARVVTATGRDGNVCLFSSLSDGKTEALRVHWGLIGSVDPQGESYARGVDLKSIWPLKVGNTITSKVNAVGRDDKSYTATVTVTVAAYEKITVPAGTFDAFRVEESRAGESTRDIHWWAPMLANTVKASFPDWRDRSKTIVLELSSVKATAR